jgi:hypothetical protein
MVEPPVVFTDDVVSAMLRTDGTPVITAESHTRISKVGDVQRDPNKEAPAAPPSLRNPGEQLPTDDASVNQTSGQKNIGVMKPVQFPKKKPDVQPGANPDSVPDPEPNAAKPAASEPASSPAPVKTPSPAAGTNQPN